MKKVCVYALYVISGILMLYGLIGTVCALIPNVSSSLTDFLCLLFGAVVTYGFAIIVEAAAKYLNREQASATPGPPAIVKIIIWVVVLAIMFFAFRSSKVSDDAIQEAAYQIAKQEVKKQLNNPVTADFSLLSVTREKFGDSTYRIKGTLTAKNSFGVEQELKYAVTMTYFEGNPQDVSSWNITSCYVMENR